MPLCQLQCGPNMARVELWLRFTWQCSTRPWYYLNRQAFVETACESYWRDCRYRRSWTRSLERKPFVLALFGRHGLHDSVWMRVDGFTKHTPVPPPIRLPRAFVFRLPGTLHISLHCQRWCASQSRTQPGAKVPGDAGWHFLSCAWLWNQPKKCSYQEHCKEPRPPFHISHWQPTPSDSPWYVWAGSKHWNADACAPRRHLEISGVQRITHYVSTRRVPFFNWRQRRGKPRARWWRKTRITWIGLNYY